MESTTPAGKPNAAASYRALTIGLTSEMLYKKDSSLVGVGLVYKPLYIPTIPFSAAYMRLNEWHSTTSDDKSESHLEGPRLLFIAISEESGFFPVVV